MGAEAKARKALLVRALAAAVGLALVIIGIRFLIVPSAAAKFFGAGPGAYPSALHHAVALRDIWLGLMALALAAMADWRALALWLGLGALCCLGDAAIAYASGAHLRSLIFHTASGILCAWLTLVCRDLAARRGREG